MQVKIKDKIYDSEKEPIMVILSDSDKKNISTMPDDNYKYCSYPETFSTDEILEFMRT